MKKPKRKALTRKEKNDFLRLQREESEKAQKELARLFEEKYDKEKDVKSGEQLT